MHIELYMVITYDNWLLALRVSRVLGISIDPVHKKKNVFCVVVRVYCYPWGKETKIKVCSNG